MSIPEIWKDIPGYEGKYQASTYGRIRSLTRQITQLSRYGTPFTRTIIGRILRAAGSKRDPHLYVVLGHGANGSPVHQLVAHTFLGSQPPKSDVRHLDGNPLNNHVENLAYGSRTENILDVLRNGHAWRKLTYQQVQEIYTRLNEGEIGATLAREYGVSDTIICAIRKGRVFKCITSQ